jgi:hypothetical protein
MVNFQVSKRREPMLKKDLLREASPGKIIHDSLSGKNPSQKRTGGVAQDVGPEFEPQYGKNKTKQKNKILSFAGKCLELRVIMLSEISHTQKDKNHVFSCGILKKKRHESRRENMGTSCEGR